MYSVIEYRESSRGILSNVEVSRVKEFDSLEDIFKKYILDVEGGREYIGSWFNMNSEDVKLMDVLEERKGIYLMSVSEEFSLYIFKNEDVVNVLEDFIFELDLYKEE
tara:strand:- start:133 stop:453 length:321 start_codon:yes stop_codon:yes gene_type:complete